MKFEELFCNLGRFWGRYVLRHGVAYLRRRVSRGEIRIVGEENLIGMGTGPWVMVSNHTMSRNTALGPFWNWKFIQQYNYPADAFILQRAVRERSECVLNTVARCDRGDWSADPRKRWAQQRLGNPFARGQIEGLDGFIPVEKNPGSYQRHFLKAIGAAIRRREPILIFPLLIDLNEAGAKSTMGFGAARIARKHALPILPVCLFGADSWRFERPVTIVFGESFIPGDLSDLQIADEIRRRLVALHAAHAPEAAPDASTEQSRAAKPMPDEYKTPGRM